MIWIEQTNLEETMNSLSKFFIATLLLISLLGMAYGQVTVISVKADAAPGSDFKSALAYANANPAQKFVIELATDGGKYYLTDPDSVIVPLTIRAAAGLQNKPIIKTANNDTVATYFIVKHHFILDGVIIDGQYDNGQYAPVSAFFSIPPVDGKLRLRTLFTNCLFRNLYDNADPNTSANGNCIVTRSGTLIGSLRVENSTFTNYADEAILMQQVNKTSNSVDSVTIRNCTFFNTNDNAQNQGQFCIKGDTKVSTKEAVILLENLTFYNCGRAFEIRDCENAKVRNIIFANLRPVAANGRIARIGREGSVISHADTFEVAGAAFDLTDFQAAGGGTATLDTATVYNMDPMFADPVHGNFTVKNPLLYKRAHDGGLIGDRRWLDPSLLTHVAETPSQGIPIAFTLMQNYPNPFNPVTTIRYSVQKKSHVTLKVFDVSGACMATLIDGDMEPGQYHAIWNGANTSSGVYFYQLNLDGQTQTRKMTLIR
jgi:hypothetical protein